MQPIATETITDLWGVAIPAWVGAASAFVGAILAAGALWVAILSYLRSKRTKEDLGLVIRVVHQSIATEQEEAEIPHTIGYGGGGPQPEARADRQKKRTQLLADLDAIAKR